MESCRGDSHQPHFLKHDQLCSKHVTAPRGRRCEQHVQQMLARLLPSGWVGSGLNLETCADNVRGAFLESVLGAGRQLRPTLDIYVQMLARVGPIWRTAVKIGPIRVVDSGHNGTDALSNVVESGAQESQPKCSCEHVVEQFSIMFSNYSRAPCGGQYSIEHV